VLDFFFVGLYFSIVIVTRPPRIVELFHFYVSKLFFLRFSVSSGPPNGSPPSGFLAPVTALSLIARTVVFFLN